MRRLTKKITSLVLLASFTASLSSMALAADVGTVTDDASGCAGAPALLLTRWACWQRAIKVSILDSENDGWLKITYTDDEGSHTGYVSAEFIKTSDSAKTKKTQKAAKKKTEKNTAKASAAKLSRPLTPPRTPRRLRPTRPMLPWAPAPLLTAEKNTPLSTCGQTTAKTLPSSARFP